MARPARSIAAAACLVGAFVAVYGHVCLRLAQDWMTDGNYSHGILIPPLAAYFAWERRAALARLDPRPTNAGLAIVAISLAVLVAGILGAELFLTRISMLGVLAGAVAYVAGWRHLRALAFPIAFLLLMIPIPAIVFNKIAFPLQLVASQFGAAVLSLGGVPVLREGNVIILSNTTLDVAEACSGIRSLVSLITLGTVLAYFRTPTVGRRIAIPLAAIPIAIVANGLRVAGTGMAAHYYGARAAEGFVHTFSGWLVFVVALALLWTFERGLSALPVRQVAR